MTVISMLTSGAFLDGRSIDALTIIVATLVVGIKALVQRHIYQEPWPSLRVAIVDFLNGSVIVPFVLMIGSVISPRLFQQLFLQNPVQIALAGLIGLIFVIGEIFHTEAK